MKNKKVLVTGADGFIGSHLVQALVQQNAQVRALSHYNSFNHWGWLEGLPELSDLELKTFPTRKPTLVRSSLKSAGAPSTLSPKV